GFCHALPALEWFAQERRGLLPLAWLCRVRPACRAHSCAPRAGRGAVHSLLAAILAENEVDRAALGDLNALDATGTPSGAERAGKLALVEAIGTTGEGRFRHGTSPFPQDASRAVLCVMDAPLWFSGQQPGR